MTLAPQRAQAPAARLAEEVVRLARVLTAFKAGRPHTVDGTEKAALMLLFPLIDSGPLRSSALAELVHADPSTVSRHVAALLHLGLVRREADPVDGRASLLAVSEAGHVTAQEIRERRDASLTEVLAHWPDRDVDTLTDLLARFTTDLHAALPALSSRAANLDTLTPEGPRS